MFARQSPPSRRHQQRRRIVPGVKESMTRVIEAQPDDATYDEILRELAFERMVQRGLDDARHGRTLDNSEMERRITPRHP